MRKIRVTRRPPKNISVSWDNVYIVEPLSGQTQAEAEQDWQKMKRNCGEFWNTLLMYDGESGEYEV